MAEIRLYDYNLFIAQLKVGTFNRASVSCKLWWQPHICLLHYILQTHHMLIIWVVVL